MKDFTQVSRQEWIQLSERFYKHLEGTFSTLRPSDWQRTTPYMGWSAHDVLAHMTGAMPVNFRQSLDRALAGNPSAPAEYNTFVRNLREVKRRRVTPTSELMREFWSELDALMITYRNITDEEWLKPAWFFIGSVNVRSLFLVQLSDNVFHDRDLLLVCRRWSGMDPEYADLLVDWFIREFRPASFQPDQAKDLRAVVNYKLSGPGGGEWTYEITEGTCNVSQGGRTHPDVVVEATTEDLVAAGLARAAPIIGVIARSIEWIRGPDHTEDVVALITGYTSLFSAILRKRVRISGNRQIALRFSQAFWHFWQRTKQTEENIARNQAHD